MTAQVLAFPEKQKPQPEPTKTVERESLRSDRAYARLEPGHNWREGDGAA